MKRNAAIVISLLAVVGMVTAVIASIREATPGVQVRFNKLDFPEYGVQLITPLDPSFDTAVSKHFRNRDPQTLKPFSVFIHNSGTKTLVAYALTWKFVRQDGGVIDNTIGYSEPGILMGDDIPEGFKHTTAIVPGAVKCFSWLSQIEGDADDASLETNRSALHQSQETQKGSIEIRRRLESELSQATDLTVSLDGIVFDDGTFVGSNVVFLQQLQAVVNAKVDLLREIAQASQRGKIDEALESIAAKSQEPDVVFSSEFKADDYYRHYRKLYAFEMSNMSRADGKEKLVPHLVKTYQRARPILRKK
jgi:hypothetical protein